MFHIFRKAMDQSIARFLALPGHTYRSSVNPDELWALYLSSFPEGTNPTYRSRTEHDCSTCRQFVKRFGTALKLDNQLKIRTIWDAQRLDNTPYGPVCHTLAAKIRGSEIVDVFLSPEPSVGADVTHEQNKATGAIKSWQHLFVKFPSDLVAKKDTIPTKLGELRTKKELLARAVSELKPDAVETVLELIAQSSLYRGEQWAEPLMQFKRLQGVALEIISPVVLGRWAWAASETARADVCAIRNTSIGTLLVDLSEGVGADEAVRKYEAVVAPANYKRPKPVFTKAMLAKAQKTVEELGLMDSLPRRFARLNDITVNNVLFADRDAVKTMTGGSPFEALAGKAETNENPINVAKVETISITKFLSDVVPTLRGLDVYLEPRHSGNLVSLIAPEHPDSKPLFAWGNNFSWAYNGNVADSMKERVKELGGKVDGVLRFSIQWSEDGKDDCDIDAHAREPNRNEIYFGNKGRVHASSGMLDVDITQPIYQCQGKPAVENIVWTDLRKMPQGVYSLFVHGFNIRGISGGFRAEIEAGGKLYSFDYNQPVRQNENVVVAEIILSNATLTVTPKLPARFQTKDLWSIPAPSFVPVSVLTRSPNWWDREAPVGNGHWFFMLRGAVNPDTPNGFFNEYLPGELREHRKVLEALGSQMKVKPSEDQLSGLGFSTTLRHDLVVRAKGKTQRLLKIQF